MKINNNKYYNIFFYICIIVALICIIFLENKEYYENVCNVPSTSSNDNDFGKLSSDFNFGKLSADFDFNTTTEEECKGYQCKKSTMTKDTLSNEENINAIYIFYDDNRPLKGVKYFNSNDPSLPRKYPNAYYAYRDMENKLNNKDETYKFAVKKDKGGITTVSNNISQFIYINDDYHSK